MNSQARLSSLCAAQRCSDVEIGKKAFYGITINQKLIGTMSGEEIHHLSARKRGPHFNRIFICRKGGDRKSSPPPSRNHDDGCCSRLRWLSHKLRGKTSSCQIQGRCLLEDMLSPFIVDTEIIMVPETIIIV